MPQLQPTCYIIAGPNGAGKTTFALNYLPDIVSCRCFVNADEIARGLSPLDVEVAQVQAGKLFLSSIHERIQERKNFAFETTLSGRTYLPKIKQWREDGWRVELFFLYLPSAENSALRVRSRVEQGGHDIPVEAINRRYPRCIAHVFEYMEVCDATHCLDNSGTTINPIFDKEDNELYILNERIYAEMRKVAQND